MKPSSADPLPLPPPDQSPPLESAAEPIAAAPSESAEETQPSPPARHIDYLGRHLVLIGLTPVGSLGIAVGATTVVLNLADSSIHLASLSIILGVAAVIAVLAI
ncbi:MAG: hypothetical protein HY290_18920, partial [Planctomycetia bacterium]|nr:hypothetical protein [Planctomycetia bacterium]